MKHITSIKIPALEGTKVIANAKDIFTGYIDSDYKKWGADKKGEATKEVNVDVFELDKDGKFSDFIETDKLLTQEQILYFCENHKDSLRQGGYATLFPLKSGDEIFVARAYVHSDGSLYSYVCRFSYDYVWDAEYRYRLVVLQLDPKTPSTSDSSTLSSIDPLQKAIEVVKNAGYLIYKQI